MRKNLHDLERIERFINGELSNSERIIFENNLESDHGLADQLEAMKIVQTAACRYVLRQKVESIGNGGNSGTFKGIITSIIVLAAIAAGVFFVMQGDNEMLSDEETAIAETPVDANNVSAEQDEMPCSSQVELQTWVEPEVQQFSFTAEDGTLIEGENGVVIVIPRGGLMYENGEIVRGEVDFELIEALTIEEMVLYGLKTNSPQGVLGSGGMIHLAATANGQTLRVNPDRPLYVEIPNPQLEPDMLAFEGVIDENSKISWENPKRLVKPLIPLPFDELDFLPEGFTEKVNSMMPMFGRDIATDDFVDSMYYLLNWTSSQVEDVFQLNSFQVETAEDSAAVDECGIHPSSIEAMVQPEFQKSFVATKDFEKRVAAIHKLTNGQEILNIYLANLDKDLFISDSIV
ncbi:MAG: hypothetical protein MK086_14070, partial [Flavobacteriales bacterium]|nr:hypothetical protein [Flavobacteriales bacterium]